MSAHLVQDMFPTHADTAETQRQTIDEDMFPQHERELPKLPSMCTTSVSSNGHTITVTQ